MIPITRSAELWPATIVATIASAITASAPTITGKPGMTHAGRCSCAWPDASITGARVSLATPRSDITSILYHHQECDITPVSFKYIEKDRERHEHRRADSDRHRGVCRGVGRPRGAA